MRYSSYESIQGLCDQEIADLFRDGDSAERIWAAWTQGIRFGQSFSPTFLAYVDIEPNSGIRRHLIVMLAGFWAKEMSAFTHDSKDIRSNHPCKRLLEALAKFDPHERVRATAWQHLIRVQSLMPEQCEDGLLDHSSVVRKTIIESITPARFDLPEKQLMPLFQDSDPAVRNAVIEAWTACQPPDRWFSKAFVRYASTETHRPIKRRLAVLCRIAHREDLLEDSLQSKLPAVVRSQFLPMVRN